MLLWVFYRKSIHLLNNIDNEFTYQELRPHS
jgi:hypothetical protein